jgi:hypothetical protein
MSRQECNRPILVVLHPAFCWWKHFFLVLNTSSRLFNFTPAARHDSSAVVASGEAILLPPYYLFPKGVIKVFSDPAAMIHVPFGTLTSGNRRLIMSHSDLISLCRPLFARKFEEERDRTKAWNSAVAFAETKLLGAQMLETTENRQKSGLLAAILARIVSVPIDNISGDSLVESHMGTILGVSDDRTILRVGYPVEPVLSEASGRITMEDEVWNSAVSELRTLLVSGRSGHCPGKGEQGEMVAMLSLLRAHDVAHRTVSVPDLSTPVTVFDLLKTFLGGVDFSESRRAKRLLRSVTPIPKIVDIDNGLLDGLVTFTRWKRFRTQITQAVLRKAFEQRVAIQCMETNEGVDLIIPVVLPTSCAESSSLEVDDGMMAGIFFQIKNHANPIANATRIASSLVSSAQQVFGGGPRHMPPILGIVWQVGGILHGAPKLVCHSGEATVLLKGLTWCNFMTSRTIESLADIASRVPFEQTIREQMAEYGGADLPELVGNIVLLTSLEQ